MPRKHIRLKLDLVENVGLPLDCLNKYNMTTDHKSITVEPPGDRCTLSMLFTVFCEAQWHHQSVCLSVCLSVTGNLFEWLLGENML